MHVNLVLKILLILSCITSAQRIFARDDSLQNFCINNLREQVLKSSIADLDDQRVRKTQKGAHRQQKFVEAVFRNLAEFSMPEHLEKLVVDSIKQSFSGKQHEIYLTTSGLVYVSGQNISGQLGLGDQMLRPKPTLLRLPKGERAIQIAAGNIHTVILSKEHVYVFGSNEMGQLGLEDLSHQETPVALNFVKRDEIWLIEAHEDQTVIVTKSGTYFFGRPCNINRNLEQIVYYIASLVQICGKTLYLS